MTMSERLNLLFHKDECFRITLFDESKRIISRIVRVGIGESTITVGGCTYTIDPNVIYYSGGIPSSIYHISNPVPINPKESKAVEFTSRTVHKMFKTKIVDDMIEGATEEGMSIKNIIFLGVAITVIALGIALYFVYQEVQSINEYIETNKDVIELIKDYLLTNGGR